MIQLSRDDPPAKHVDIYHRALQKARKQFVLHGGKIEKIRLGSVRIPKAIREVWLQRQGWKCAYCERPLTLADSDMDDFRPKKKAFREPEAKRFRNLDGGPPRKLMPTYGYPWLAAHPINVFVTCTGCNRNKGIYFPLDPTGGVLEFDEDPPGNEVALLIHPVDDNPAERIRFVPVGLHWWVVPRNNMPQGQPTIDVLELNSSGLRFAYDRHVKYLVQPHINTIRQQLDAGDKAGTKAVWDKAVRELFGREAPFQLLSRDVLVEEFPASVRESFDLALPPHLRVSDP